MSRKIRVLVVDDDAVLRKVVAEQISLSGFDAHPVASGEEALRVLKDADFDVVLLDIRMPGLSGLEALREIRKLEDPPEVIMLTADTSLTTGIEAMRHGAYDYLTKPSTLDEIEAVVRKAEEKRRLVRQNASLRDAVVRPAGDDAPALVYRSGAMEELVALAETAAQSDSTVVITGESGTGKDVIARFIHARSPRGAEPVITVNCAALPESLFESEFFGHEKGAFTGASALKRGLIEAADGSTLFLDEVGEMPPQTQAKLLQFLEEGRFRRVGSTRDRSADVRVIAATNRRLAEDVSQGRFRADLFYRLNVISLHVPPLRERREDIPALVEHFLSLYRERFARPALDLSQEARTRLEAYDWPGNVRELRNALERAAALTVSDTLEAEQVLPAAAQRHKGSSEASSTDSTSDTSSDTSAHASSDSPTTLEELERQHILRVLRETGGNRERAAVVLGISARTLYRKLREYETNASSTALATEDS
ncbi:MAG TPA: sigma-54 dependent transcriptional regulator [Pyrinomonadaceae bacterium]|nr:sigma-54 dependent transcriptional regulator [Pyrinomonadaceae bacterium]